MCGIVGYVGAGDAVPMLLEGLRRLEYRGYDSAGVAVRGPDGLVVRRSVGRLANLEARLAAEPAAGSPGIGHTRWATHGEPSERNAHPHRCRDGSVAVVHNGIIENYQELREALTGAGGRFESDTDTEVIAHLIRAERDAGAPTMREAIRRALGKARGAYALGILCREDADVLYAARHGSPLVIGIGDGELFIASDVPAIADRTRRIVYLEDGQIAALRPDGLEIIAGDGRAVTPQICEAGLSGEAADRAGYETYMLKEIHEQPRVIRELLRRHLGADNRVALEGVSLPDARLAGLERVIAISCGTAFHAAMYAKLLLESLCDLPVEAELGSEFRYRNARLGDGALVLAVSQSGETADTLASVRAARRRGGPVLSVCNVEGSSLARESDAVLYTGAGPEIGVASTKAYTTQLVALALLCLHLARVRGQLDEARERALVDGLRRVPDAIHYVLRGKEAIRRIAEKHHDGPSSLYLGRRFNYPTALEGALKNKEISYQHAEGYAAGEMKHGPIALVNEYLPVICVCTRTADAVYEKMLSNMEEVRARHGRIIAVANDGDARAAALAEDVIYVPEAPEEISPMVNAVALQLLAYYAAQARGTDIDKPRNLAKSVTVE